MRKDTPFDPSDYSDVLSNYPPIPRRDDPNNFRNATRDNEKKMYVVQRHEKGRQLWFGRFNDKYAAGSVATYIQSHKDIKDPQALCASLENAKRNTVPVQVPAAQISVVNLHPPPVVGQPPTPVSFPPTPITRIWPPLRAQLKDNPAPPPSVPSILAVGLLSPGIAQSAAVAQPLVKPAAIATLQLPAVAQLPVAAAAQPPPVATQPPVPVVQPDAVAPLQPVVPPPPDAYKPFCSGCGTKRDDGCFCPDCGTAYTKRARTS